VTVIEVDVGDEVCAACLPVVAGVAISPSGTLPAVGPELATG
jgi:hypothetical protein